MTVRDGRHSTAGGWIGHDEVYWFGVVQNGRSHAIRSHADGGHRTHVGDAVTTRHVTIRKWMRNGVDTRHSAARRVTAVADRRNGGGDGTWPGGRVKGERNVSGKNME